MNTEIQRGSAGLERNYQLAKAINWTTNKNTNQMWSSTRTPTGATPSPVVQTSAPRAVAEERGRAEERAEVQAELDKCSYTF